MGSTTNNIDSVVYGQITVLTHQCFGLKVLNNIIVVCRRLFLEYTTPEI